MYNILEGPKRKFVLFVQQLENPVLRMGRKLSFRDVRLSQARRPEGKL